jgi:hypothetical protein
MHPVRGQLRDLGLVSSTTRLLLPHKPNPKPSPNPLSYCKVVPTSKVSTVFLGARQWSLRFTSSLGFPTVAMMDGLRRTWLNWRKNWGWFWKSSK